MNPLKKLVSFEINFFGILEKIFPSKGIIILLYHQITPNINEQNVRMAITPNLFAQQMEYLAQNNYSIISLNDFLKHQEKNIPLSPRQVIITFDDGFKNNYLYAFPVLKKHKFKATIFLSTDFIGQTAKYSPKLNRWITKKEDKNDILFPFVSWLEMKQMAEHGIEFGAHTCSHPVLTKISLLQAEKEIKESKKIIENNLNKEVKFFAYPFGVYNQDIENLVKKFGFSAACTVYPGGINNLRSNPYALKRNALSGNISDKYFRFLLTKYYKLQVILRKKINEKTF